ncbi:hypothetical protein EGW08_003111 [Elysia chlorotica]|uniref:Neurotransmitter-gated ion-channel ligand-binding domain-containing protein n=1 Tax=Elysia chlorotica TaxID=188477 RepID=A0A433U5M3_ELYCH|nr:hypothetical protein EGW08_003111 [Elysia chlorotica]
MKWLFTLIIQAAFTITAVPTGIGGATIQQAKDLYSDVILAEDARTRPIVNQSTALEVAISASLFSLLEVDEVKQSISVNVLVRLSWTDEIRKWDPAAYGGLREVDVSSGDIWFPRILNGNSVSKRDTFGSDYAPLYIQNRGMVIFLPGGILHTSCLMDLTHYPFDSQTCSIELVAGSSRNFVVLTPFQAKFDEETYIENSEWDLLNTSLEILNSDFGASLAMFDITIKRKPGHIVLTILVPVNIVSALSNLVFLTPLESGERVSFSITALLALSVYTSEVSKTLPNNSEAVPYMVIYLACLLLHAAAAIVVNLGALMRHHKKQNQQVTRGGQRVDRDSLDGDYISISDDHISDFDGAGRQKLDNGDSGAHSQSAGHIPNSDNTTMSHSQPGNAIALSSSASSTQNKTWRFNLTSMFIACARRLNYGETDFRADAGYRLNKPDGGMSRQPWLYRLLLWMLQFVGLADLIMFLVFFIGWLVITVVFVMLFTQ